MSSDAESRTGAGAAVLAKVQTANKKLIAVILAVVFVLTVVPVTVFMSLKGKAEAAYETPRLVFDGSGNYVVPSGSVLSAGSYLYEIDGKDWTYNLERDYTEGDILHYDSNNHTISATHNSDNNHSMTRINTVVSDINTSGDNIIITLSGEETLQPDTTYCYKYGGKYYIFSFTGEEIGRINDIDNDGDFGTNTAARQHNLPDQNDKVTIVFNKSTGAINYSGTSMGYDRRTIYVESTTLDPNEVYLITFIENGDEYLLCYDNSPYSDSLNSAYGYNSAIDHTTYVPTAEVITHIINDSLDDYYRFNTNSQVEPYAISSGKSVIDGNNTGLNEVRLDNSKALPEFLAVSSHKSSYMFLRGYNLSTYTN